MSKRILFGILAILGASAHSVQSQSMVSELNRTRQAYLTLENYSFDVEAYSYSTPKDEAGELISKGTIRKSQNNYYSSQSNYEMLILTDRAVVVDKERKTIDYYEYVKEKPRTNTLAELDLETLLPNSDSVLLVSNQNGLNHFTCYISSGYIRQIELYIDEVTHLIRRIQYFYTDSDDEYDIEVDHVDILYKNIETHPMNQQNFSLENYLHGSGSALSPAERFKGYEINYHPS